MLEELFQDASIGKIGEVALAIYYCEQLAHEGKETALQKALELMNEDIQQRALKTILEEAFKQRYSELAKRACLLIKDL